MVAWSGVAFDRTLGDPVSFQLGVPDGVAVTVLFVPASVIVAVQGAVDETASVEVRNEMRPEMVAPVTAIFPTL